MEKKELIKIPINSIYVEGSLIIPKKAKSIIIFVHGSGSSRHSPRNQFVAKVLQEKGFATFLFDLLTEKEDQDIEKRFNIDFLTKRLIKVTEYIIEKYKNLEIGYFGASTGAAAALDAATILDKKIKAIVSRGGRPDLANESTFQKIQSPTLFIVGSKDIEVLELNKLAMEKILSIKKLEIIVNATHLFEEKGALEKVADIAADWFLKYLISG